jgi:hypothetical protein
MPSQREGFNGRDDSWSALKMWIEWLDMAVEKVSQWISQILMVVVIQFVSQTFQLQK